VLRHLSRAGVQVEGCALRQQACLDMRLAGQGAMGVSGWMCAVAANHTHLSEVRCAQQGGGLERGVDNATLDKGAGMAGG
jgi:hypothetical protein